MWPFRRPSRKAPQKAVLPAALRAIGDETPRRFSIILADPARSPDAREVLAERLGRELTVEGTAGVLDVATAFQPGSAAVLRPLNVLERAGIAVSGLELSGLVTEITDEALLTVVHDWSINGNAGPYRRRVERLAGPVLLDRCLTAADAAQRTRDPDAAAWRFAVTCVAFNTPGAETRLIDASVCGDDARADELVDAASDRVRLARLAGLALDVPAASIASALRRRGHVAARAAWLASMLPAPVDAVVSDALIDLAERGGEAASASLAALRGAAPSSGVRAVCDAAIVSDDPDIRAAGLELLARHWTDEARPVWREALASTSAPVRWTAEDVIGEYGAEEDLQDAAAHLAKLIRARKGISMSPPRGSAIVDLMIRHHSNPAARVALEDLTARWPRLSDDMRTWLEANHPSLAPVAVVVDDEKDDGMPEEHLTWPSPSVERTGSSLMVVFDEVGAHQPVRDRFEELAARHPSVELIDGDREWVSVVIDAADPEALVRELWSAAGDLGKGGRDQP